MSECDEQGLAGMDEQQSPSPAEAGTSDVDASAPGLAGAGQGQGATGSQSGVLRTRGGTDRSDILGGLAGGMDSGDVTGTGRQADASQEGANIQP